MNSPRTLDDPTRKHVKDSQVIITTKSREPLNQSLLPVAHLSKHSHIHTSSSASIQVAPASAAWPSASNSQNTSASLTQVMFRKKEQGTETVPPEAGSISWQWLNLHVRLYSVGIQV